jgi:Asp-tRNA(Asn)/Glu-tRNA(Gln) amidotransferase B subunit
MFRAQRENWVKAEMQLDRKTEIFDTRLFAQAINTSPQSVTAISTLVSALQSAEEIFNSISCERLTETYSASDALDRAKAFADRGAIDVRFAISKVTSEVSPAKVDASDVGRALRALIDAHPAEHKAALEKPSLRGWFVGQIMKEFDGKVATSFVSDLVETVFEFTAPLARTA